MKLSSYSKSHSNPCKTCGKVERSYFGRLFNSNKSNWYTEDGKRRGSKNCSECHLKRSIRYTNIYYHSCRNCFKLSISKNKRQLYCSIECRTIWNNSKKYKKYSLECQECNTLFESNRQKKFCSHKCFNTSRRKKSLKTCKRCDNPIPSRKTYCSKECKYPKKEKKCLDCQVPIQSGLKCGDCKNIYKPTSYDKTCDTCGKKFISKRKDAKYCNKKCFPSKKQARKLRKRAKRSAKLNAETWRDIDDYIKNRPKGAQLDHIIPLNHEKVCGLHNTWNFQWLSPEDNRKKSNSFDGTVENTSWKKFS